MRQCVVAMQTAVSGWTYFPTPACCPAATPLWNRVTLWLTPTSYTDRSLGSHWAGGEPAAEAFPAPKRSSCLLCTVTLLLSWKIANILYFILYFYNLNKLHSIKKQTNKHVPSILLNTLCTLRQTTCVACRYKLKRKLKQLECYVFPFSGLKFFTEKKILPFLWLVWIWADSNDLSPTFF